MQVIVGAVQISGSQSTVQVAGVTLIIPFTPTTPGTP